MVKPGTHAWEILQLLTWGHSFWNLEISKWLSVAYIFHITQLSAAPQYQMQAMLGAAVQREITSYLILCDQSNKSLP